MQSTGNCVSESEFCELDEFLPNNFARLNYQLQTDIIEYIRSLTRLEQKAYLIAKQHLGSSFDVSNCCGFIEWKTNHK
jgi:hypothetical protein